MTRAQAAIDQDIAEEVETFLRTHPSFLSDNPDLYRVLTPPARVYGEAITDHMAAMIRVERAHAAAMTSRAEGVLSSGRAAASLAERVQDAVIALMRAADPIDFISGELPSLLGIDAASLCLEGARPGTRALPDGMVERLLGGRDVVFRQLPTETGLLHGEAAGLARADAIVRIRLSDQDGALVLAARDRRLLHREQGTVALAFLGQALSAALARA